MKPIEAPVQVRLRVAALSAERSLALSSAQRRMLLAIGAFRCWPSISKAAVDLGDFKVGCVPQLGHRHYRFRCAHNERPLFSRHSGIGIYAVAAISMLRAHAAQIQWVRCGLRAAVRCNWLGCPLSGPNRPTNFNVDHSSGAAQDIRA